MDAWAERSWECLASAQVWGRMAISLAHGLRAIVSVTDVAGTGNVSGNEFQRPIPLTTAGELTFEITVLCMFIQTGGSSVATIWIGASRVASSLSTLRTRPID